MSKRVVKQLVVKQEVVEKFSNIETLLKKRKFRDIFDVASNTDAFIDATVFPDGTYAQLWAHKNGDSVLSEVRWFGKDNRNIGNDSWHTSLTGSYFNCYPYGDGDTYVVEVVEEEREEVRCDDEMMAETHEYADNESDVLSFNSYMSKNYVYPSDHDAKNHDDFKIVSVGFNDGYVISLRVFFEDESMYCRGELRDKVDNLVSMTVKRKSLCGVFAFSGREGKAGHMAIFKLKKDGGESGTEKKKSENSDLKQHIEKLEKEMDCLNDEIKRIKSEIYGKV